jgi:tetratricopeptide (TPR) repeat protein
LLTGLLAGCEADAVDRSKLDAGEKAFKLQQYDQAIADSSAAIPQGGATAAEAYYVRGRAVEDRPKANPAAAMSDLQLAARDYSAGLQLQPMDPLLALLHTQLGNVLYFQDNYSGALQQWTVAYKGLGKPEWQMWVLYRMGICQQRLGRFADADRTFQQVQDDFPDSEPANRAKAHQGVTEFYVQVGAFANDADIQRAAAAVVAVGAVPQRAISKNLTVIRTGGVATYDQAKILQARLAVDYRDAVVMP